MVKLFGRKTEELAPSSVDDQGRPAVIDVRDITRTYEMGEQTLQVLKGITLGIYQGEFVSIMGPSGSGKSTLMNILGALDRPTSGEYYLDGVDVSKMSETKLAEVRNKKIGFVFQSFNLLKRTTAMRQVELPLIYSGAPNRSKRAKAALEAVGLGSRLDHLPSELSGGQQQRVAIARAIVTEPAMILADEPTGNLDSKSGTEVMQIFQRLNREMGITTVFVTHDSWIARHTDRVIMIRDGRVVADHLIAAPLTAGEQERPSDDEELAGLLEQGYGRPGQATIAVPEPTETINVNSHVEPVRPTGSHAQKPAPVEAKAPTTVTPAVSTAEVLAVPANAPFPFDEAPAAPRVPVAQVPPAAATVETPRVAEPLIPFDDVSAPVEEVHSEIAAEPAAPVIPFDEVMPAADDAEMVDEPVIEEPVAVEPVIPFDDVESLPADEPIVEPMAEAAPVVEAERVVAEVPAVDEPTPEAPAAARDEEILAPEPVIEAPLVAAVTTFDEPTHYPTADAAAPVEAELSEPVVESHDDAHASTVDVVPEPYVDERRDGAAMTPAAVDLSDFQGSEPDFVAQTSEPTVIGFVPPQGPELTHVESEVSEPDFLTDVPPSAIDAVLPDHDNSEPDFLSQFSSKGPLHPENAEPDFLAHMSEPTVVGFKLPTNGAKPYGYDFDELTSLDPAATLPFDDHTLIEPAPSTNGHTQPEPSPLADWLDDTTSITNGNGHASNGHVPNTQAAGSSSDER